MKSPRLSRSLLLNAALTLTTLLGACVHKTVRPVAHVTEVNRVVQRTTETAVVGSADNVRFGEIVKAYPIGRYRDPADPRMMHERHVVYRVEKDPAWKLEAPRSQQLIVGNLVTDRRSTRTPITSQELTSEVLASRAQNESVGAQQRVIAGALGQVNRGMQSLSAADDFTARKLAETSAEVRLLKERAEREDAERRKREASQQQQFQSSPYGDAIVPPSASTGGSLR